jgi:hypothetical protein
MRKQTTNDVLERDSRYEISKAGVLGYEADSKHWVSKNLTTEAITMSRNSVSRRSLISVSLGMLAPSAIINLLTDPLRAGPLPHDRDERPSNTFVVLLRGKYKPVVHGPDLGLAQVNLSDGSYSKTKIFRVSGLPEDDRDNDDEGNAAIGTFYVQFAGSLAVYDLPGGALKMIFTQNNLKPVPDGQGGTYLVGDILLDIADGTGIFRSFLGGHNHMVDILHQLADGSFVEHCFCIISRKA